MMFGDDASGSSGSSGFFSIGESLDEEAWSSGTLPGSTPGWEDTESARFSKIAYNFLGLFGWGTSTTTGGETRRISIGILGISISADVAAMSSLICSGSK